MPTHLQEYSPAQPYRILPEPETSDAQLIELLVKQAAPALPSYVLDKEQKEGTLQEIVCIMRQLRNFYADILKEAGLDRMASRVRNDESNVDIDAICRKAEEEVPDRSMELAEKFDAIRDSLTADLLERFGFLPISTFSRENRV
ncbi:hypothetical protein HYV58_02080, partial [Candidatus Peregrinibacteria bacterium]|nr:hypothetical protein [Candidatus Peregrinibacteria bacterium]